MTCCLLFLLLPGQPTRSLWNKHGLHVRRDIGLQIQRTTSGVSCINKDYQRVILWTGCLQSGISVSEMKVVVPAFIRNIPFLQAVFVCFVGVGIWVVIRKALRQLRVGVKATT
ncbi:hypothetical protein BKA82DRAFT_282659 [Pisolithus tinctorius]|uniref:Uncharacterized protein n=1 Tax=Pisolithus tinctorius Marx 270 TaxID=870435 RepID=A0A0C3PMU1_PISTI|nr:hypothetical protein BKA82DRAFT_282659 [Pisolithus tinctorius]KIO09684.1 hypothetical protein M404DRAFT_282659 [Pisolithus tinctorius Marx 270]